MAKRYGRPPKVVDGATGGTFMNPALWVWRAFAGQSPAAPPATSPLVQAEAFGDDRRSGRSGQPPGRPSTVNSPSKLRRRTVVRTGAPTARLAAAVLVALALIAPTP